MISNRFARFVAATAFFFSVTTAASAATTTARYSVLFDTDDSSSTGCSVQTPGSTVAGIEQVLTTTVDTTDGTPRVTKLERQTCGNGTLSAPITVDATGWPVGTTSTGDLIVETHMPKAVFGASYPAISRLYFVISNAAGNAGSVMSRTDSGSDIMWPNGSRRRIVNSGSGAAIEAHNITVDGSDADWTGLVPFLSGAPSSGSDSPRFAKVFVYPGESDLFFNFNVHFAHGTSPVSVPDEYTVRQGRSINVTGPGVLANDTDPNGLPLKAVLDTPPVSGTLVLKSDGGFSYTQNGSLVPTDSFQYRADNGSAQSDPAKVTLHVQPDSTPVAVPDAYNVAHGGTLTVPKAQGVLINDHDADGDPMTTNLILPPQYGTLTLNADGSFTYTHDGSNTLHDTFRYRANDGILGGNVTVVTITIGPDAAPVAVADSYNVNEGATLTVNAASGVLANDTDVDSPASMLTASLVTSPAHGTLTFHADGSFSYVQDGTDNATDSFTYKIADNIQAGNTVTVTINVTLLNDAPVAVADSYTTLEDTPLTVAGPGLLANDTDEEHDPLTAHVVTQPAHGTVVVNANGGFTYTPATNYNGPDSFTYAANDGQVDSNVATVTLSVTAVNDVPTFSAGNTVTVLEDNGAFSAPWATAISAGPSDEAGQALNFIVSNNNNALFSVQPALSATGVLTFTPAANANGSATVTVQLHDNGGTANGGVDTTTAITFTINVTPVNDVPSFTKGADQSSNEDAGAQTVNSWATAISAGPADEAGQTLNFIVVNDNNALFSVQPAISSTGTLTYTAAPNANGTANVTVQLHDNGGTANGGVDTSAAQTFLITVNGVNDAPVNSVPGAQTTLEDTQLTFSALGGNAITVSDIDANNGVEKVTLTAANGTVTLGKTTGITITTGTGANDTTVTFTGTLANLNAAMDGLTFLPSTNFNGSTTLTILTDDQGNSGSGGALTDSDPITINVTPVNDAPFFTKGADQTVLEDSGAHTINGWATGISAGAADESGQTLTFNVTNNNNALFSVQPAIDASGNLTFTSAANAYGSATVTVTLTDNGGTANGGADTSVTQTFTITVTPVNDVPSFTKGADQTVLEDSGAATVAGWATGISAGPNEATQTVNFIVSNNNNALFSVQPAVDATGALTYTPAANANGSATVTVQIHDDGGTANGGVDTSASQTFVINVTAVNDAPSFTKGADVTVLEDSGANTVNGWATSLSAGPADESGQTLNFIVSNDNNALFSAQPAIDASGNLTFTPAANAFGTATVTVQIHDNGGTANGGVDTSASQTFTITVTGVNDVPSFTKGADQTVLEDSGTSTVAGWATGISAGPNEGSQTVNFIVSNNNNALFSTQPAVSASGALTFTPAANANGSATVTVQIHDDGGTANGGVDTSASQTFVINVTPVNDVPSFTKGADQTVNEDAGAQTVNGWATSLSAGPADEAGQTLNFIVSNDNNALFSVQPAVDASGNLTYTPSLNANGTATVTVQIHDNGGTANGGVDTSAAQTFTITVSAVNDAPTITAPASVSTNEDTPSTFSGTISFADVDGASGSETVTLGVAHGTLTLAGTTNLTGVTGNGTNAVTMSGTLTDLNNAVNGLVYLSSQDYNGADTLHITIDDNGNTGSGGAKNASADVAITIVPVNDAPVAVADNFSTNEDTPLTVNAASGVLANDTDIDTSHASLTAVLVTGPANASSFTLNSDGSFSYTPSANFNGSDSFTYKANDGSLDSNVVTVTITVNAVNDAPVITRPATVSVNEDTTLAFTAGNAISIADVDGNGGSESVTLGVSNGTLSMSTTTGLTISGNGTGSITASGTLTNLNNALATLTYLGNSNYNGSDTLTIGVNDNGNSGSGGAQSDSKSVAITVNAVNDAPTVSLPGTQTVFEDQQLTFSSGNSNAITVADIDAGSGIVSVTLTTGNGTIAVGSLAGLNSNSGNGTGNVTITGTLTALNNALNGTVFTPTTNFFGAAVINVTVDDNGNTGSGGALQANGSISITVNGVNDAPSFTKGADQTVLEDAGAQTVNGWATGISAGPGEGTQTVHFNVTGNSNPSLFSAAPAISATGTLTFTPAPNANGTATITINLQDDGGTANGGVDTSAAQSFVINVTAVNDVPSFTKGADVTVLEDSGANTVNGWATALSAGPADESGQTLNFIVSNNNNALFSVQPAVDASGNLTFTPAANAFGTATVTVQIHDNGGTANGGVDTSASQTFTINVTNVNDAPSFTKGADQTVLEDAAAQTVNGWATGISAGPGEGSQTVHFNVTNNNNALFSVQPAVSATGTLTYTLAPNANGTATVSVVAQDDGGTANGGVDTSAAQTFAINVTAVNDTPSFTKGADVTVNEDSGAFTQNGWATALSAGPSDESSQTLNFIVGNDNNALFSVQPAVSASGNLTFTPAANAFGTATVTVQIHDNGGTANGGSDTSASQTFTITVNGVNDAPSFTKGADQTVLEDAAAQTVAGWATGISAGPGEGSQTVHFNVTNNNNALFSVQPAVSATGTLTYTLAANANGTATVSVVAQDDGGTANGGVDSSAAQTFNINVTAVNDVPSFTKGADVAVNEDSGAYSQSGWATAISAGPADESGQALNFIVTNNNNSLFSVQPAVSATGALTFTPAANASGSATVTIQIHDDGGTANGGVDTSVSQTFTITVNAINDAPSFTKGADQTVLEDASAQTVNGWATAISDGPGETGQTLNFIVTNDNNALFSVQPAIDASGNLTYTLAADANGSATVSVQLHDDGGTANGGSDTSATQTFTITVTPVNDAPTFAITPPATPYFVLENSGATTVTGLVSSISPGPANESSQTVTLSITNNTNPSIFSVAPAIDNSGNLTFTLNSNTGQVSATLTIKAQDNGGVTNGGVDFSTQTFTLNVEAPPKVTSTVPTNGATSVARTSTVTVNFNESVAATTSSFTVSCNSVAQTFTLSASPSNTFVLTPNNGGSGQWSAGTCTATVLAAGISDTDTFDPPDQMAADYVFSFVTNTPPTAQAHTITDIGNVTATLPAPGLLTGASDPDAGQTLSIVAGTFSTSDGGSVTYAADGSFTYTPAVGHKNLTDTVSFTVSDGNGGTDTKTLTIALQNTRAWFVKDTGTNVAGGNGSQSSPFTTMAQAYAAASSGETTYVLKGAGATGLDNTTGHLPLTGQLFVGEGVPADATVTLSHTTLPSTTVTLASATGAPATITRSTAGATVTLASGANNTFQGLIIKSTNGAAITAGAAIGTLTMNNGMSIDATSGPALNLPGGTLAATLASVNAANSTTSGISLTNVAGSLTITAGTISGSTTAGVNISGGTLSLTSGQNISATTGALVSISGSHATGTVTFSGTLSATGGTGLQLTAANGTYSFPATTTLNGGSAQVNIGGTGTFTFASGMTVTNPAAAAFQATGAPNVTYSGSLAQNTANAVVSISAQTGGTITFNTGTIASSSSSTGVVLNNADGTVNFNSASTALTGVNGYAISNGSSGTFNFTNTHSITSSGTGFSVDTSNPTFNYPGSITANTAKAVSVNAVSGGSSTFSGNITSGTSGSQTGLGISVTNSSAGTIAFTGGSKSLYTSANSAVTLTTNTGATINFTGGGLAITTTTGSAFNATGGGTVSVTGTGNTINQNGASVTAALNLSSITVGGVTFDTVNAAGGTTGVNLSTIASGTVTINGGTISGTTTSLSGSSFSTLSVANTTVSGSAQILNLTNGTVNGTFTSVGGTVNGNVVPVFLSNVGGTFTVSGGTITKGTQSQPAISVVGGNAAITWQGSVTQNTGNAVVSVNTTANAGTLTFNTGTLTAGSTSTGLQFAGANGTYSFANLTCTSCANAVNIGTSTGTFTFGSTFTPSNSTGTLINITGTQPKVDYQGAISQTTSGTAIAISGVTGGTAPAATTPYTIRFSGNITKSTAAGNAILMSSNSGGVIGFTGATLSFTTLTANAIDISGSTGTGPDVRFTPSTSMAISTTTGAALSASNSSLAGTITITGTANTVTTSSSSSTGGVVIKNMNIGASGVTFKSISINTSLAGVSGQGIVLDTTGTSGSFVVTGNTASSTKDGSGGTIAFLQGSDGAVSGNGIYMNNTKSPSFKHMNLHDFQNFGIRGLLVAGYTMDYCIVNGTNGTLQTGDGEGAMYFGISGSGGTTGLTGSASITNSDFAGGKYHTVAIFNENSTSLNRVTFTSDTFAQTDTLGADALTLEGTGGTFSATVSNSTFTAARGDLFQLNILGTITSDLVFTNNQLSNSNANIVSGGGGITIGGGGPSNNPTFTYLIQNNTMSGAHGAMLAIKKGSGGTGANYSGTIDNNTIGTSGVQHSGSTQGEGIAVYHDGIGNSTTNITNNHVYGTIGTRGAIDVYVFNGSAGQLTATVTGNTIGTLDQSSSFAGIAAQAGSGGSSDNNKACITIGGTTAALKNTIDLGGNGSGIIAAAVYIDVEANSRMGLFGQGSPYSGSATDATAVQNYEVPINTLTNGGPATMGIANITVTAGNGVFGTCPP